MSIQSEINRISQNISDCYDAVSDKGGDIPVAQTSDNLSTAIASIPTSGLAPTPQELTLSGDCHRMFAYGQWDWFLNKYKDSITTTGITSAWEMFIESNITDLSDLTLNFSSTTADSLTDIFRDCQRLTDLPTIANVSPTQVNGMFDGCYRLREIPDSWFSGFNWSQIRDCNRVFEGCRSLIHIPTVFLQNFYNTANKVPYNSLFTYCYALPSLDYVPVKFDDVQSNNIFQNTFHYCSRLNSIVFSSQMNKNWSNQVIDLSNFVGYASSANNITGYNSGLTASTRITDSASYQALKNNPNSWTTDINYSRYNHNSAVSTINSLPDTHLQGSNNVIKFKGASGALTDGGAINTLTASEIAVATNKGWTVTLT